MSWKEQMDKAVSKVKSIAESEQVRTMAAKARETSSKLAAKAKEGALSTARAFVEANTDPSSVRVNYLNAGFSIVSPSEGLQVGVPHAGTIVVSDGAGNSLVINASADKSTVAETVGSVKQLSPNTWDLGPEDGINIVVLKD